MAVQPGAEIFRDYATDGVASSGAHKPSKSEMRAWMAAVESALDINQPSAVAQAGYRADYAVRRASFNSAI